MTSLLCGLAHGSTLVPIPNPLLPRQIELRYTGHLTDLAINGTGCFLVKDRATSELFATRFGQVFTDADGHLVTRQGFRLQGFNTPILLNQTYAENTQSGDLKLDKGSIPAGLPITAARSDVADIYINRNGQIIIFLMDGTVYVRGQIILQDFEKPSLLRTRWLYLLDNLEAARPRRTQQAAIVSGALEASFPTGPGPLLDRIDQTVSLWNDGGHWIIQVSTNLVHWTSIFTNRVQFFPDYGGIYAVPTIRLRDTNATTSVRFYRATGPVIYFTGVPTDLAISGEGLFVVKNAKGESFATRGGHFHVDANGFLVTEHGLRIQGFSEVEPAAGYKSGSVIGDIKLDKGSALPPGATVASLNKAEISNLYIDALGKINILLSDGTQYVRGQILFQNFSNPFALVDEGNGLLGNFAQAGPLPALTQASSNGLGRIDSGFLEIPVRNN